MSFIRNILNSRSDKDGNFFINLSKTLGFKPTNIEYYKKAFTHRSMNKRDKHGNAINYERLEFLGDAMLGAVIALHLFKEVPKGDEGYLTKMRSKVVSREHLNELGKELKLIDFIKSKISKNSFGDNVHGFSYGYIDKSFTNTKLRHVRNGGTVAPSKKSSLDNKFRSGGSAITNVRRDLNRVVRP